MKKYQIFISSTYEDLKNTRKKVIENILDMGHIPTGMELFHASNQQPFEYIQKVIDDTDYFILIIAGCYGSINYQKGISYTQMEYEYANSKAIPILVFIRNNIECLECKDNDLTNMYNFISEVKENRIVKFWNNDSELIPLIINSLNEEFDNVKRPGWIRDIKNIDITPDIRDYIVENYHNGYSWYEKYLSGKIRQGCIINAKINQKRYITLLHAYNNNLYNVQINIINRNDLIVDIIKCSTSVVELYIKGNFRNNDEVKISIITEGF